MPPAPGPAAPASGAEVYVEVLRVPLRWWALATMFLASVLLALLVAIPVGYAYAATGVLVAITATFFVMYGGARVSVLDGELTAGRARIPVGFLAEPTALDLEAARRLRGVDADARAYLLLRPYLPRAVQVRLTDPADPTPYWLVATRHPRTLAATLTAAIERHAATHPAD